MTSACSTWPPHVWLGMYGLEIGDIPRHGRRHPRSRRLRHPWPRARRPVKVEPLTNIERSAPARVAGPGTFVTPQVLEDRGWVAVPSGRWLIELAPHPPQAAGGGPERRGADRADDRNQGSSDGLGNLRVGATMTGTLVALGIVAMTVGLLRSEAGRDLRVLAATGGEGRTRRTITAPPPAASHCSARCSGSPARTLDSSPVSPTTSTP